MGILRGIASADVEPLTETVIGCGLQTIEVTMNTSGAGKLIAEMARTAKGRLTVGAGTVLDEDSLKEAVDSGAAFIVTPVCDEKVIAAARKRNLPVFPGALTPTEAYKCWQSGATMVKIFPASCFGPKYFRELKGPFADIKLMAVGGVRADNVKEFFSSGADAVAVGASIFNKELLRQKNFGRIQENLSALVGAVKDCVS